MSWNRAGTTLAVGHQDSSVRLWSSDGQLITTLHGHTAPIFDVAWSEDGNWLVSAGLDSLACLWTTKDPLYSRIVHRCAGHKGSYSTFYVS
jgi:WD40 repeat protein